MAGANFPSIREARPRRCRVYAAAHSTTSCSRRSTACSNVAIHGDRPVVPGLAAHHAEAADRVGQHGHRHPRADGDRPGGGRRHRHHRSRIPPRRYPAAGPRSRESQAHAARDHPRPYTIAPSRSIAEAARDARSARRHAGGRRRPAPAEGTAHRARPAIRRSARPRVADRMTPSIGWSCIAGRSVAGRPSS